MAVAHHSASALLYPPGFAMVFRCASAGTAAILHSFTLAQLTKRMSLTRKNEEAAASLQESEEAAANLIERI